MSEDIETLIQSKGLNAPRVTPRQIEEAIACEYYVTGDKALQDCPISPGLSRLTLCILELKNGFVLVGSSACADPANFDAEVGRKAARNNAVNQIWPLEGYALRQRLHDSVNAHSQVR